MAVLKATRGYGQKACFEFFGSKLFLGRFLWGENRPGTRRGAVDDGAPLNRRKRCSDAIT